MIWPDEPWFGWLASGALGLTIGSFLNVVVLRMPEGQSIAWPGSHCPKCQHALSAQENIPLISWLVLQGRCRWCQAPISPRYPLIEALTGALFVGAFMLVGWSLALPFLWAFLALGVVIACIDLDTQLVFDLHTFPGIALGLVYSVFVAQAGWSALAAILYALAALALLWGLSWALLGEEGIGSGDFLLVAMLGAWLGLSALGVALALAFVVGALHGTGHVLWADARSGQKQPALLAAASAPLLGLLAFWGMGWPALASPAGLLALVLALVGGGSLGYGWARKLAGPEAERPRVPFGPALIAGGFVALFAKEPMLAAFWALAGKP